MAATPEEKRVFRNRMREYRKKYDLTTLYVPRKTHRQLAEVAARNGTTIREQLAVWVERCYEEARSSQHQGG